MIDFRKLLGRALGLVAFAYLLSPAQFQWTWRNALPQGNDLNAVVWTGSQLVAVGEGGAVVTSPDGKTWTARQSGTVSNLLDVMWTGSRLVAVGDLGTIAESADGVSWAVRSEGITNDCAPSGNDFFFHCEFILRSIAWNGKNFLIAARHQTGDMAQNAVLISADARTWKVLDSSAGSTRVLWTGERFLAAGTPTYGFAGTIDGENWSKKAWPSSMGRLLSPIRTPRGVFAILDRHFPDEDEHEDCGAGDDEDFVEEDSLHGTPVSTARLVRLSARGDVLDSVPMPLARILASAGDSLLLAVGDRDEIYRSRDGVRWDTTRIPAELLPEDWGGINALTWTGEKWVAVGGGGMILTSPDGIRWTAAHAWSPRRNLRSVAWTGKQFVVLADSGFLLSPDAENWRFVPSRWAIGIRHITWTGKRLIGVGDAGLIRTSLDGIEWYTRPSGTRDTLRFVRWTGTLAVAVGDQGTILTSADGSVWESRASGTKKNFYTAIWTGRRIFVGGHGGTLYSSLDGVSWTAHPVGDHPDWSLINAVAWNGKIFLTGGGAYYFSPDGTNWSEEGTRLGRDQYGDMVSQDLLVAGPDGWFLGSYDWGTKLAITRDGRQWKSVLHPGQTINAILWTGKRVVVIGNRGGILTSP